MNSVLGQIPNALTLGRGLAGPVGGYILVLSSQASLESDAIRLGLIAAVIFVIAALTDGLDGWVARRLKAETALGALLDPIADKLLVGGYLIAYCSISGFDGWLVLPIAVILARDLAITALRFMRPGPGVLTVTPSAKLKTAIQMMVVAAPFILVTLNWVSIEVWYHYWIGSVWFLALLTIWSAMPYLSAVIRR